MSTSFTEKKLSASLTLSSGAFTGSLNTKLVNTLRMHAHVKKGGQPSKNELALKIHGMLEDDMNALTSLSFKPMRVGKNLIQVNAGDVNGMSVLFSGEITSAYSHYSDHDPVFVIKAAAGYYPAIATSQAKSYRGGTQVALLCKRLADEMGYAFENNGVTTVLDSPYLSGSATQQLAMLGEAADLEWGIDDGVVFIAPRNKPRVGNGLVPLISPDTGLIGYPTFDKNGLKLKCLYNPSLQQGGLCSVSSSIRAANGTWRIHGIEHELSSEDPSSKWETTINATQPGVPPTEDTGGE